MTTGTGPDRPEMEHLLSDCDVTTFRASGPGGQHRNRRESGVRLVHRPTGIVVVATERRSQHQNKAVALARLARRLAERRRVRKKRMPTKATAAARARRLREKKVRSAVKTDRASGRKGDRGED
jgi:protein subunit release factor B